MWFFSIFCFFVNTLQADGCPDGGCPIKEQSTDQKIIKEILASILSEKQIKKEHIKKLRSLLKDKIQPKDSKGQEETCS